MATVQAGVAVASVPAPPGSSSGAGTVRARDAAMRQDTRTNATGAEARVCDQKIVERIQFFWINQMYDYG